MSARTPIASAFLLLVALLLAVAAPGFARTADGAETVIYRLEPKATYQVGCQPPCKCALFGEPLRGTFALTEEFDAGTFKSWKVRDVNLAAGSAADAFTIVGNGTYSIFSEVIPLQRLVLHVSIDEGPRVTLDSGWVEGAGAFPTIDIAVAQNGFYCLDTVLDFAATPVEPSEIVPYTLTPDSSFYDGCFDPCQCITFFAGVPQGAFSLVPLEEWDGLTSWAMVNIRLRLVLDDGTLFRRYAGGGFLTVADGPGGPPSQSMLMTLTQPGVGVDRFDNTFEFAAWPQVNGTVDANDKVCYDTTISIVAEPN